MKRIIITPVLALLLAARGCAPASRTVGPEADRSYDETAFSKTLIADVVDGLIPRMAAENVLERERPQQEFEALCLETARPGEERERVLLCEVIVERLGPQTPKPARAWMLRQLALVGGDESVETLAKLLDDQDRRIREHSRRALQTITAPSAAAALRAALDRAADPAWQVALINALAARPDRASVQRFTQLTRADHPDVARAAVVALGEIGEGSATLAALNEVWRGANPTLRGLAAAALLRCADRLLADGERARAAGIFEDLYLSSAPRPTRVAALRGLALAQRDAALPRLFALMRGDDPQWRDFAVRFALDIPGGFITRSLTAVLPHLPLIVQPALLEGLGERGDPAARPVALKALESQDGQTRVAALRALEHLGDSSTVTLLAQVAAQGGSSEREAARASLSLLRGEDVDHTIIAEIHNQRDAAVRCELIRSLGPRWCRPGIPALFAASKDDDKAVKIAAFETLGGLAERQHLPVLVGRLIETMAPGAREAAENAVVTTALRLDDPEERVEAILAELENTSGKVKASLIRVLGRIRGTRALAAIRAARRIDDLEVVDAAVRALADWPDPEVLADLLETARTSANQTHAVLALRGYIRLVRLPSKREPQETFELLQEALKLATRADEMKLVLAGLAEVNHPKALEVALSYLDDVALREEAGIAALGIARMLAASGHPAAPAAIERVAAAAAVSETLQKRVAETNALIERFEGYCGSWVMAGPYWEEGKKLGELFAATFPPETSDLTGVEWVALVVNNPGSPWVFELSRAIGGENRCAYVRTRVWSDTQQPATLEIGSDDAVKAWLNGELVHSNLAHRGVTPGEDKVPVRLDSGWNTLMLKIAQGGGDWGFCAGFKSADGEPLPGLRFKAE